MKILFILLTSLIFSFYQLHGQKDSIPPAVVLNHGIGVALQNQGDSIVIPAKYFNYASFDYTRPWDTLKFTYSDSDKPDSIFVAIDELEFIQIEIKVADSTGNFDKGSSFLYLSANTPSLILGETDTIPPTPILNYGRYVFVMSNFSIFYPTYNYNLLSFDNVTPSNLLHYTIYPYPDAPQFIANCQKLGTNNLTIFVWDESLNFSSFHNYINVLDNGCETPVIDSLPPVPINSDPYQVEIKSSQKTKIIWPNYLDNGSYDNFSSIHFGFDPGIYYYQYGCQDIGTHPVNWYVFDEANNYSKVNTFIQVVDPFNICNNVNVKNTNNINEIAPNPVHQTMRISSSNEHGVFSIISNNGIEIIRGDFNEKTKNINTSNLIPGIYYYKEIGANGSISYKQFIKI